MLLDLPMVVQLYWIPAKLSLCEQGCAGQLDRLRLLEDQQRAPKVYL